MFRKALIGASTAALALSAAMQGSLSSAVAAARDMHTGRKYRSYAYIDKRKSRARRFATKRAQRLARRVERRHRK